MINFIVWMTAILSPILVASILEILSVTENGKQRLLKRIYLSGEYQVEFNEEIDGVPVRGFLDCLGDGFITDSKSSRSVSKFRYDVNSWSYDIQAYIYTQVFGIKDYYWVVQEKTYPFYPALVKCSDETLFKGEMKFNEAVGNIKQWLTEGSPTETSYAEFIV